MIKTVALFQNDSAVQFEYLLILEKPKYGAYSAQYQRVSEWVEVDFPPADPSLDEVAAQLKSIEALKEDARKQHDARVSELEKRRQRLLG